MTTVREGPRGARGQVLITFALLAAALMGLAALAVDTAGAWWMSESQTDAIAVARETAMGAQNAIKFGETSGSTTKSSVRTALDAVTDSLQQNLKAVDGSTATVTVYELSRASVSEGERVIGVSIKVTGQYDTTFARLLGIDKVPVSSGVAFTIQPYSSTEVWRKDDRADSAARTLTAKAGSAGAAATWHAGSVSAPAWRDIPKALRDAISDASSGID